MSVTEWSRKLEAASSEGQVAVLIRAYVAQLPASDFKALPAHCRPTHVIDGEDVVDWAYKLAAHHCKLEGTEEREAVLVLEGLTSLFAQASRRLASFALHQTVPKGAPDREARS